MILMGFFEVLLWYDEEEEGDLGVPDEIFKFRKLNLAAKKYRSLEKKDFHHLLLMEYESSDPDADGEVIFES